MSRAQLSVTDEAKTHLLTIMSRHADPKGLRLSIKRSGCSGFMYAPEVVEQVPDLDAHRVFDFGDELTVYVPEQDIALIQGTEIALVEKVLSQKHIIFNNPNAVNACGCGESFAVKDTQDIKDNHDSKDNKSN